MLMDVCVDDMRCDDQHMVSPEIMLVQTYV
jgi:hypothetical protein